LFERERETDPDWRFWNLCARANDLLIDAHGHSI
jgi:hypothetical protein